MNDADFLDYLVEALAGLPAVEAVTLGGSRATGTAGPQSDWDLAVYYRDRFDPQHLRDLGWAGEVFEVGGWGGGVYNGGAWLDVDGRKVDVHYRDLARVELEVAEAEAGRLHYEPLMFHIAGIPTYLVVAELAINRVLRGELPRPSYPAALRRAAPPWWWNRAKLLFWYARDNHAAHRRAAQAIAMTVEAASCAAHAVLAARAEWVTNEKRLLARAGLDSLDYLVSDLSDLTQLVDATERLCAAALREALASGDDTEPMEGFGFF